MNIRKIRRVVTGHDAEGKAIVVSDAEASNILSRPNRPGVALTNLWQTFESPAPFDGDEETVADALILHPPKGGTVFRVVQFDPEDAEALKTLDGAKAFAEMGAGANVVQGARHPFMHRTDSVDYAVVLTGRIMMLLDDSEIELSSGDVVVQRGTNHAWSNRFDEPCQIAFILVDGYRSRA